MKKLSDYVGRTPLIPIEIGEFTVWEKRIYESVWFSKGPYGYLHFNDLEKKEI